MVQTVNSFYFDNSFQYGAFHSVLHMILKAIVTTYQQTYDGISQ